jgi:hypothetical protein
MNMNLLMTWGGEESGIHLSHTWHLRMLLQEVHSVKRPSTVSWMRIATFQAPGTADEAQCLQHLHECIFVD